MRRRRFFQVSALGALVLASALWAGERIGGRRQRRLPRLPGRPTGQDPRQLAATSDPFTSGPFTPRCLSPKQLLVLHTAALRLLDGAEPVSQLPDEQAGRLAAPLATPLVRTSLAPAADTERLIGADPAAATRREDALETADSAARRLVFIDRYLLGLEVALRADVRALIELLEHYPLLTGRFARFSRLTPTEQDAVLRSWQASRFALLRQGLQALKSMVFLAHYQDASSFGAIGYSGPLVPAAAPGY